MKAEIVLTTETAAIDLSDPTKIVITAVEIAPSVHIRIATIVPPADLKDRIKIKVIPEVIVQLGPTKIEITGEGIDHNDRIKTETVAAEIDHSDPIKIERTETEIVRKGHHEIENLAKDQSFTRKPNDSISISPVAA